MRCQIVANDGGTSWNADCAGGVNASGGVVDTCLVATNRVSYWGGAYTTALGVKLTGSAKAINCTIVHNVCKNPGRQDNGNGAYPITYGWAITVHKSQGLTFDYINLARGFFAEAQLYVAISRCRTLKGIHLVDGDITVEDIKICQRAYDFQYGDLVKEMELPAEPEVEIEPEGEEEELMM